MSAAAIRLRPAQAEDAAFVLALAPRFVAFPLPAWRGREDSLRGIRADLARHLAAPPTSSHLFVATDAAGARVGFLHLQELRDFFSGASTCHISDLATSAEAEGRGIGRALLHEAEAWACARGCTLVTLNVFPGNARALRLYREAGYDTDLLRLARPLGTGSGTADA